MKKIVITDDHSIVRVGLKGILSDSRDYTVVAEAASGHELKKVLATHQVDALILDLSMPGGSGLELLKEIKLDYENLPILILSFHGEDQFGLRAYRAGASGYLSKECAPQQLTKALGVIIDGRRYFAKTTEDQIFSNFTEKNSSKQALHHSLSDRELHVFTMLGAGKTLTSISKECALSVHTISTYRQRILKKMHMKTNAEIVIYAVSHGLVPTVI